jgi:PTH1 family peptidyl-tRNA hydrolase
MRLVVGLGNPGLRYAKNRHNIGFLAVEAIARRHGFPAFRDRFKGELSEGLLGGEKRLLLRPQTFMNDSGESVLAAASFYKIPPAEIVVIHDEIDLRPGKLRVKQGGGAAGHNGLRSIDAHLGQDYWRVRIGVGHPGVKELVQPYVLQNFPAEEINEWVIPMLDAVAATIPLLLAGDPASFMSEVARLTAPPKEAEPPKDAKPTEPKLRDTGAG